MSKLIDLTGKKFGRLTVIERVGTHIASCGAKAPTWLCKCECGRDCIVMANSLRSGKTKSCGCIRRERSNGLKHGLKGTRIYDIWQNMKQRCNNPNNPVYRIYGAEGKTVCEEWIDKKNGFINFYNWSMSHGYEEDLTIDRIDNTLGYSPSNCRWTTMKEQNNNTRRNKLIEYNCKKQNMKQWSEELGINYGTLQSRISNGWSIEETLTIPPNPGNNQTLRNDLLEFKKELELKENN